MDDVHTGDLWRHFSGDCIAVRSSPAEPGSWEMFRKDGQTIFMHERHARHWQLLAASEVTIGDLWESVGNAWTDGVYRVEGLNLNREVGLDSWVMARHDGRTIYMHHNQRVGGWWVLREKHKEEPLEEGPRKSVWDWLRNPIV